MDYWQNIRLVMSVCLRKRVRLIILVAIAVLVFNILDLALPKVLQLLVASLEGRELTILGYSLENLVTAQNRIIIFTLMLPGIALLKWGAGYARGVLEARLGQGALYDLRNRIFTQVQALSFAYHDQTHSGRFIANIVEDVGQVSMFFERPFFMLFQVFAGVVCIYAFMFSVSAKSALVSAGVLLVFATTILIFRRFGYPVYLKARASLEAMVSSFSENMEGNLLIRSFGKQDQQKEQFSAAALHYHNSLIHSRALWSLLNQSLLWGVFLGIPSVLATSLYQMRSGQLSSDNVFLLFLLQNMLILRMRMLSRTIDRGVNFSVSAQRLGGLFNTQDYLPDVEDVNTLQNLDDQSPSCLIELPAGDLSLTDVNFSYRNSTAGLKNITLSIKQGQTIGLVGETGSGKSTLALLMCRFYDPESGSVTIGSEDIRHLPLSQLRSSFALVFQDTFLFSCSVKENISYGNPQASEEEIIHAAELAQADEFIRSFPEGYATVVGEKGVTLSGGQRQRIAIARAILRKPRFLVLDDATSSLDMETESNIQQSISQLPQEITRIIIAHRFSSIENADHIYVLSDGEICEHGTPAELNNPGSEMSRILQLQQTDDAGEFPACRCDNTDDLN